MGACNETIDYERSQDKQLLPGVGMTFFHTGLIISAFFALFATTIALYLMVQHARHYLRPWEQKHIIRILFMIPIYSLVSFLSYYYYRHAIYFEVLRDCYEAFAIASFFSLMCNYVAPNIHEQKDYFRGLRPVKNWLLPINWMQKCTGGMDKGPFRRPASGLTWFNILWICVFQYCVVRVFFTIVSVLAQAGGRYCADSNSPEFAHVWVTAFEAVSVTFAMYGLIQLYYQLKEEIAEHRPFLKILCIKLVIFLSFWQNLAISFGTNHLDALQPTEYLSRSDIKVGIPSMLLCIEMAIFSVLHIWAFPWKRSYTIPKGGITTAEAVNAPGAGFSGAPVYHGGFFGIKAFADAFNPWDIVKAIGRGFRWLFVGRKHRRNDSSYVFTGPLGTGMESDAPAAATKLQPLGNDYPNQNTNYDPHGGQHLQAYPPKLSPYDGHAERSPFDEDDDPWNPNVRGTSRSPSPLRPAVNTTYSAYPPTAHRDVRDRDDTRGLLHQGDARDPFGDEEEDVQPSTAGGRHVRKMSSAALEKHDSAKSPEDLHPAYRPEHTGRDVEREDERARGPGRGGWV